MGEYRPRQRGTNLQDGFSNCDRTKEMSHLGMSGTDNDADGDQGTLLAPACQRHHDHTGGGKTPPPMVFPQQLSVALEGSERAKCYHRSV